MTPEAVEERVKEAKIEVWKDKQVKVEQIMSKYVSQVKSLDPNGELQYRGSLAKGKKFDKKTEKHVAFDPTDFDVDAFISSDAIWKTAAENSGKVSGAILSRESGISKIRNIEKSLKKELLVVPGMRKSGKLADFEIIIRSVSDAKSLFSKPGEKQRTVQSNDDD